MTRTSRSQAPVARAGTRRRALLSVARKDGLGELGRGLTERGFEIVSTGGSAAALREAQVPVTAVQDVTGFPEILDGRVKTLHPHVHAGLLARRDDPGHLEALRRHSIVPVEVLVVNLYPFEDKVAKGAGFEEALEHIDIGGPAMLRAAAKNFRSVAVVVDPTDYGLLLEQLDRPTGPDDATRLYLAQKAFRHSARYEAAIAAYFAQLEARPGGYGPADSEDVFPYRLVLNFEKVQDLRYGENPHQRAAFYSDLGSTLYSVTAARQLHGKELSFNNLVDLDAAWRLVTEIEAPACVIVKHTNPCGVGVGATLREAWEHAWECDPVSAFGGILAFNRRLDLEAAQRLDGQFIEAVIAPGFEAAARERLSARKGLRLMDMDTTGLHKVSGFDLRRVVGGLLAQEWDLHTLDRARCRLPTRRKPSEDEWRALDLAWTVCKHVKSNAIVLANQVQTVGVGAGQMSRVDAARQAVLKARLPLAGCAAASDAFFPFRDGLDEIAKAGATAVIQPGGSVKDEEVIAAADEHGLAMVFTSVRHFRH